MTTARKQGARKPADRARREGQLPASVSVGNLVAKAPGRRRGASGTVGALGTVMRANRRVVSFTRLQERLDVRQEELLSLVQMTASTLSRRRRSKASLDADTADRIWRLGDLLDRAAALTGSEDEARAWLKMPAPALGGERPLDVARTEAGAEAVRTLITQIEHGIPP